MYEGTAILRGEPIAQYDEYGNELLTYETAEVFVKPRSVYATEFYQAAQLGIRPTIVLELTNRADYADQKQIEYGGKVYEVIRADWKNGGEGVALTLAERSSDG